MKGDEGVLICLPVGSSLEAILGGQEDISGGEVNSRMVEGNVG